MNSSASLAQRHLKSICHNLDIWVSLCPKEGLKHLSQSRTKSNRLLTNLHGKIHKCHDMNQLWTKQCLPASWSLDLAFLSSRQSDVTYVTETYHYPSCQYDGENWMHHLALIITICFSRVIPDIEVFTLPHVFLEKSCNSTRKTRNSSGIMPQLLFTKWLLIHDRFLTKF